MRTKFFALPLLLLIFSAPSFSGDLTVDNVGIHRDRVVDNAGTLSVTERMALASVVDSLSAAHNFDLVIVTEKNIGSKSPQAFADDFFDNNGYGMGDSGEDGCVFLQVTGSRDMYFSTAGRGIKILNSYAYKKLDGDVITLLRSGDNYAAYRAFTADWDKFLKMEAKGRSYNFFHVWNVVLVLIAWLVALGIGSIVVATWKSGMNTALQKTQAATYITSGSLDFTEKKDSFLYSTTTKTKLQTAATTAGTLATVGKLGGHIASSGRRHGGGGRKY